MTKPEITLAMLREKDACADQVAAFEAAFPSGRVTVTVAKARKFANVFAWNWAARAFLTTPAWAEYDRVRAPARAEYGRAKAPARAEYDRAMATAWATAFIAQSANSNEDERR